MTRPAAATVVLFLVGVLGSAAPGAPAKPSDPASATAAGHARGAGTVIRRRCPPGMRRRPRVRGACTRVNRRPPPLERLVDLTGRAPAPGEPAPGDPVSPSPSPTPARYVSVAAREFSLTLSRPVVAVGSVTVELRNVGEDPHDLVVGPDDGSHSALATFPETGPASRSTQAIELAAGSYRLWCSLEGHEAAGMTTTLRVE